MSNNESRIAFIGGCWLAMVAMIAAFSVAAGASLLTSALLFVLCVMPMGVALLIGFGAPSPTVAEVLYAVHTKTDRR